MRNRVLSKNGRLVNVYRVNGESSDDRKRETLTVAALTLPFPFFMMAYKLLGIF